MAKDKSVDFVYMFSEKVHAYRCVNARYRNQVGRARFAMVEAQPCDAPLAFIVKEGLASTEVRLFSGTLYRRAGGSFDDAFHAVCPRWESSSWEAGDGFKAFKADEPSKDMPSFPSLGSEEKAVSDARDFAAGHIVIDGVLWKREAEPSYRLGARGTLEVMWGFSSECFNAGERRAADRASAARISECLPFGVGAQLRANSDVGIKAVMNGAVTYPSVEERSEWAAARIVSGAMERSLAMLREASVQSPDWISEIQSKCASASGSIVEAVACRRRAFLGGPADEADAAWARDLLEASCPPDDETRRVKRLGGRHAALRY